MPWHPTNYGFSTSAVTWLCDRLNCVLWKKNQKLTEFLVPFYPTLFSFVDHVSEHYMKSGHKRKQPRTQQDQVRTHIARIIPNVKFVMSSTLSVVYIWDRVISSAKE
jgi:hypothetical protein